MYLKYLFQVLTAKQNKPFIDEMPHLVIKELLAAYAKPKIARL